MPDNDNKAWPNDWPVQTADPLVEELQQSFLPTGSALEACSGSDIHLAKTATAAHKQRCLALLPGLLSLQRFITTQPSTEDDTKTAEDTKAAASADKTADDTKTEDTETSTTTDTKASSKMQVVGELHGLSSSSPTLQLGDGLQLTGQRLSTSSKFLALTLQPKKKRVVCRHVFDSVVVFGQAQCTEEKRAAATAEQWHHYGASRRAVDGGNNEADDTVEYLNASTVASRQQRKKAPPQEKTKVDEPTDSSSDSMEEESGDEDEFKMNLSRDSVSRRQSSQRKSRKTVRYNEIASGSSDDSSDGNAEDSSDGNEDDSNTPKAPPVVKRKSSVRRRRSNKVVEEEQTSKPTARVSAKRRKSLHADRASSDESETVEETESRRPTKRPAYDESDYSDGSLTAPARRVATSSRRKSRNTVRYDEGTSSDESARDNGKKSLKKNPSCSTAKVSQSQDDGDELGPTVAEPVKKADEEDGSDAYSDSDSDEELPVARSSSARSSRKRQSENANQSKTPTKPQQMESTEKRDGAIRGTRQSQRSSTESSNKSKNGGCDDNNGTTKHHEATSRGKQERARTSDVGLKGDTSLVANSNGSKTNGTCTSKTKTRRLTKKAANSDVVETKTSQSKKRAAKKSDVVDLCGENAAVPPTKPPAEPDPEVHLVGTVHRSSPAAGTAQESVLTPLGPRKKKKKNMQAAISPARRRRRNSPTKESPAKRKVIDLSDNDFSFLG